MTGEATDPLIHEAAVKMARRIVWVFAALLREEERLLAYAEAYDLARAELEDFIKRRK